MPNFRRIFVPPPEWIEAEAETRLSLTVTASRALIQDDNSTLWFNRTKEYTFQEWPAFIELPTTDQSGYWRDARTNGIIELDEGESTHSYTITLAIYKSSALLYEQTLTKLSLPSVRYRDPVNVFDLMPLGNGEGEPTYPPAGWERRIAEAVESTQESAASAAQSAASAAQSATSATQSAASAAQSATSATSAAQLAQSASTTATDAATAANASAMAAAASDAGAYNSAQAAENAASRAGADAAVASDSADAAIEAETNANNAAVSAGDDADAAAQSASAAEASADRAETAADIAGAIQHGRTRVSLAPGVVTETQITFPTEFPRQPNVVASVQGSAANYYNVIVQNPQTTGFEARCYNSYTSSVNVYIQWIAIA